MAVVQSRNALKIWGDVIFAIFLREVKSRSGDRLGVIWSVISPVVFIFMLSFVRGRMDGGNTHGIPTFFFMVFGLVLVQFFLGVVGPVSGSIRKNQPLYAFRQVQPISSVIAIAGFELLVKLFVVLVIALICFFLRLEGQIADPMELILIFFRIWVIASSLGLLFALAGSFVKEVHKLRELVMRPVFFISGIFFSLHDIPREWWPYLTWNPLLHAVELARFAAYPNYGHEGVSYFFLDLSTFTLLSFALACYYISWKPAISR